MDTSRRDEQRAIPAPARCSKAIARAVCNSVHRLLGRQIPTLLMAIAVASGSAGPVLACAGDCGGDGSVSISELITGVSIALGDLPLSVCTAFDVNGDGVVGIDELVMAVNAALTGCPPMPTPSLTPTAAATATATETASATATATPTASPSATPTVPMVAGQWQEAPLAVTGSTCPSMLTDSFADDLAGRPPCDQSVEILSESMVALTDCTGMRIEGSLDRDGTIHVAYPTISDTVGDCTIALTASAVISAGTEPTVAAYTFALAFTGTCPATDCTIDAEGTWTRL
jgi:hypothetical protein